MADEFIPELTLNPNSPLGSQAQAAPPKGAEAPQQPASAPQDGVPDTDLDEAKLTPAQRKELVCGTFADCHLALREVLAVMAERGQADLLPRVFDAYRELLGDKLGICVVDVTTAVPLDDGLRQLITEKAEADLGRRAVLRERIDASILGGIIMDVDGNYIDASMISQLNRARNVLKDTTDGGEC